MLMPSTLSLIRYVFLDARDRRVAIATWAAMFSGDAALGPVRGGWLLGHFWWGSLFFVNVPIIIAFVPLALLLPESRDPDLGPLDLSAIGLSLGAMLPPVFAIKNLAEHGLTDLTLTSFAVGVIAAWTLVRRLRTSASPMIDLTPFGNRVFTGAIAANLLGFMGFAGFLFLGSQLLQLVLGLTAMDAALVLLPGLAATVIAGFVSVRLLRVVSARVLVTASFAASAAGYAMTALNGTPTVVSPPRPAPPPASGADWTFRDGVSVQDAPLADRFAPLGDGFAPLAGDTGRMSVKHSLLALLVAVLWGLNFVVIDEGLADVPPLVFLAMRFSLVAFPLVLFVPRPKARWTVVVAVGTFMSLGQFSLLYVALDLGMPAGLASLVLQAQVIFTIGIAALALREIPSRKQLAGAMVGTAGLMVVAVAHGATAPVVPLLVMLGAALSWATGNVIARSAGVQSGFSLVVWSALVVPVPALALSLMTDGPEEIGHALTHLSVTAIASTAYTAIGASLIGYGIWNSLLARYPAGAVVPFVLLVPVVGIAAAWIVQDEVPTGLEVAGGVVMLIGVAWATINRRVRPAGPPAPSAPAASASTPR
jgi:O-acetylserine/cysteine efflux transporter